MGGVAVALAILLIEATEHMGQSEIAPTTRHSYYADAVQRQRRFNRAGIMIACLLAILAILLIFAGSPGSHEDEAGATELERQATTFPTLFVNGDCESFRFIASMTWPEVASNDATWARVKRIMRRESGCHSAPYGSNDGGTSFGLMQIHMPMRYWGTPMKTGFGPLNEECGITSRQELLNPATNLRCARVLWLAFGWSPWAT